MAEMGTIPALIRARAGLMSLRKMGVDCHNIDAAADEIGELVKSLLMIVHDVESPIQFRHLIAVKVAR